MPTNTSPKGPNPAKDFPPCRLGINIDHVATLRNARGGQDPDPVRAARLAIAAGADGITAHLREDRRHIRDDDMRKLRAEISKPLNFEMAATPEMVGLCLEVMPHAACLVPERRMERTTEGGLDIVGQAEFIRPHIERLLGAGIRVSLFIDPDPAQVEMAKILGAPVVELHTGDYQQAALSTTPERIQSTFDAIKNAAEQAHHLGIEVHAGHGLNFQNVQNIAAIPPMRELNIGHFLMGEAIFMGLDHAVKEMKRLIEDARTGRLV
ncbi:MAG: pyridoxine 5'-phosphate synthase [Pseudomonadota bacterium]